jgi:hypothetical protein
MPNTRSASSRSWTRADEIIGLDPDARCDYCDERAGPPGPQSGPVYLVRNPIAADLIEPLHEDCAAFWFEWLAHIPREICDRMLNGARARMRSRVKGEGGTARAEAVR